MATFPYYVKTVYADTTEQEASSLIVSEMDRGVKKYRRQNSDAMATISLMCVFAVKERLADFKTWFYNDINAGADFFDFTHPVTGATVQARIVNGALGSVRALGLKNAAYTMDLQLEYLKDTY